ncbi:hypothetical protein MLD38_010738 [Melastoma candidum]|uniref:Uncharacterized protein n=1 Tax=Melastoma candidum TaxID=119954 RepID=A0ACB9R1X1_9MYRT|nr:hypothetical protein MLD38_010738 [Melastoma candidum]
MQVEHYGNTVAKFIERISKLRNKLGNGGLKDEGLTPEEILEIIYGSGNESIPGGFFPEWSGRQHLEVPPVAAKLAAACLTL